MGLPGHFFQPVEIGLRALHNGKADDFRNGIGMKGFDFFLQFFEPMTLCLNDEQPFLFVPDPSFPSINRANRRDEVGTSDQMSLHKRVGDLQGLLFGTTGDKDNDRLGHNPA